MAHVSQAGSTNDDLVRARAELENSRREVQRLRSVNAKPNSHRLTREVFWYPLGMALGLVGFVAAITTGVIKLIG